MLDLVLLVLYASYTSSKEREKMKYTLRRLALSVVTLPIAMVAYAVMYFGLALLANSYASVGLFVSNLTALGFGWVLAVTFSKQFLDFINRVGE